MAYINSKEYKDIQHIYEKSILEEELDLDKNKEEDQEGFVEKEGVIKQWTRENLASEIKDYITNVELDANMKNAMGVIYQLILKLYPYSDDIIENSVIQKVLRLLREIKESQMQYSAIKRLSGNK